MWINSGTISDLGYRRVDHGQTCFHSRGMEAIVAFLDVLGFSEYVTTDIAAASELLGAHTTTLIRLEDQLHHPPEKYSDPGSRELAHRHAVDSFLHFLPMSDSIVIVGNNPELFVEQLSTFLVDAFMLQGHAFAHPDEPATPTAQNMKTFSPSGVSEAKANWFPALWRGGVSFGKVEVATLPMIRDHWPKCAAVAFGSAVVEAVGLEKSGKGPRLFCSPVVAEHAHGNAKPLLVPCNESHRAEILWPLSVFTPTNDPEVEKTEFLDLFLSARALWLSKIGTKVEQHYWEFIRLICRSAFHWASHVNAPPTVVEYISTKIKEHILPEYSSKLLADKLR